MSNPREVWITGMGVVSPIGIGAEAVWDSLLASRSGVARLTKPEADALPASFGGEVRDFDPKQYVKPRKSIKVMCREIQFAFAAAEMATQQAGISAENVDSDRLGVVLGSEIFYTELADIMELMRDSLVDGRVDIHRMGEVFKQHMFPLWMLKYLPNMPACHIGIALDAHGPNNTLALAEVSGLAAIWEACSYIGRDHADVVMTGGCGSRLEFGSAVFRGHQFLSRRRDEPARAHRPFDADRDGMANGEGAASFVLESRRHAEARGAKPLARILGIGNTYQFSDDNGPTGPQAICRSIEQALAAGGKTPADLSFVSAHGLATIEEDIREAQAIRQVLGDVPVTALKSYFGNLGAGTSAVETAISLLALKHGLIPPTLNYETPDPRCNINIVHGEPQAFTGNTALILSQTRTGQAYSLLIESM